MTAVAEAPVTTEGTDEAKAAEAEKRRERDFTKFTDQHSEIADFVNADQDYVKSGLDKVTPGQVKAILALRTDFADTPEKKAEREKRKAEREAEKKQYEGMTEEQIKLAKQEKKANDDIAKMEKRIAEAREKAEAARKAREAGGEDLAAAVEADKPAKPKVGTRK